MQKNHQWIFPIKGLNHNRGYRMKNVITGLLTLKDVKNVDLDSKESSAIHKRLIKEIIKIVRKKSDMMLVTLDSRGWKTRQEELLRSKDASFNPFYFEDALKELALAEDIYYLGLQTEFRKDWEKHQRELHWGHWNYDGHKVVASVLAAKIAKIVREQDNQFARKFR